MQNTSTALVITSIAGPKHPVLNTYAEASKQKEIPFIVIGDKASPAKFELDGCIFYGLGSQKELPFTLSKTIPEKHYSRKNIGYLLAIKNGAEIILETDDDNIPYSSFWDERTIEKEAVFAEEQGWLNVYKYFTDKHIWPRGFDLPLITKPLPEITGFKVEKVSCPIQQGLADEAPDVDAIYRLTSANNEVFIFDKTHDIAIGKNTWCPFNSQNTTWFRQAFPLLYLPSFCSFRMTDIWRSFVAQRVAWTCNWNILFHNATVKQERNEHNLLKDFEDEISGYLNNGKICAALQELQLPEGEENILKNLYACYKKLVEEKFIDSAELELLDNWIDDLVGLGFTR